MKNPTRISIVTPNFNLGNYLEETIDSILSQGYPNLEYIVIDGGSTDNSIEIIKKYEKFLSYWVSEPDKGLYDALNKGFKRCNGEIMGWLNSDDKLHRDAFSILNEVFSNFENIDWVQGFNTFYDETGRTVRAGGQTYKNKYFFLLQDFKNFRNGNALIQQESTFWRRRLWDKAGGYISTKYKLASDFELWMRFFDWAELYTVTSPLGGFRYRGNNLSIASNSRYFEEVDEILKNVNLLEKDIYNLNKIKYYRQFLRIPILRRIYGKKHHRMFGKHGMIYYDFNEKAYKLNKCYP